MTELQELIPDAPGSALRAAPVAQAALKIPVGKLFNLAKLTAYLQKDTPELASPFRTPPMGKVSFTVLVKGKWVPETQGSVLLGQCMHSPQTCQLVGLQNQLSNWYSGGAHCAARSLDSSMLKRTHPTSAGYSSWGWSNFFGTGPMAGGWDAAAWEKQGMPTKGEVVLTLKVTGVSHAANKC